MSSWSLLAKCSGFPHLQAEQSKEEQKQGLSAEKLMRKASKDVCRLREQSQKVPLQVQSFRYGLFCFSCSFYFSEVTQIISK